MTRYYYILTLSLSKLLSAEIFKELGGLLLTPKLLQNSAGHSIAKKVTHSKLSGMQPLSGEQLRMDWQQGNIAKFLSSPLAK